MMKIFLTAMLVLFGTSSVVQAQMTPMPDPSLAVGDGTCAILRQEVRFYQDKIILEELRVIEATERRDKAARNLAIWEKDLTDALMEEPPRLKYVYLCITNVQMGQAQLADAEAGLRNAERISSGVLAIYESQLYFAKLHYSQAGCLPLIP